MNIKPVETHNRSLVKSVSYRVVSVMVDAIVAYYFTRNVALSAGIVIFVDAYSTLIYYLHERAWAHIHWGRGSVPTGSGSVTSSRSEPGT